VVLDGRGKKCHCQKKSVVGGPEEGFCGIVKSSSSKSHTLEMTFFHSFMV
jgi:hypothetical protein